MSCKFIFCLNRTWGILLWQDTWWELWVLPTKWMEWLGLSQSHLFLQPQCTNWSIQAKLCAYQRYFAHTWISLYLCSQVRCQHNCKEIHIINKLSVSKTWVEDWIFVVSLVKGGHSVGYILGVVSWVLDQLVAEHFAVYQQGSIIAWHSFPCYCINREGNQGRRNWRLVC